MVNRVLCLSVVAACTVSVPFGATAQEVTVSAFVQSDPFLGQRASLGYGGSYGARIAVEDEGPRFAYALSLGYDERDEDVNADGSFVEYRYGTWAVGVGAPERHWGPSNYTSLILSRNARPVSSAYIRRDTATSDVPILNWLGPWSGEFFVGALDGHSGPETTQMFGMRLAFAPLPGLDIELVRTAQFSADATRSGSEAFFDALIGREDAVTGTSGNQLAGIGISYSLPQHVLPLRVYGQAIGEDEAGGLPSCFMFLGGVEAQLDIGGAPSTITLEGTDTQIERTTNGNCGANTAYRNSGFPEGYTNAGAVMGSPIDTAGHSLVLYGEHELDSLTLSWSVGTYSINRSGLASHRLSSVPVSGEMVTLGARRDWENLSLQGHIAYQGFDLDTDDLGEGIRLGMGMDVRF